MKKVIFISLGCILLFSFCSKREKESDENSFYILVNLLDNSRSGKDYVKLRVNDSLLFSGSYFTDLSEENIDDIWGMEVASFNKQNKDSIKIKLRLISLDTVLFSQRKIVDTTFYYKIKDIPGISITDPRGTGHFSVFDTLNAPAYWRVE
ncbi:MAG: hypothetical protein ACK5ND_04300 [Bacteroides sp.]